MWLKRQNLPEQVHVTCQLRVADFFEDTVWYSNMSRGKSMAISNSPSYYKHCKADIMENY